MNVPGYWMSETSGVLAPVVLKYLDGAELDAAELATMRDYLAQWMRGSFEGPRVTFLRQSVSSIRSTSALRFWLRVAIGEGIDPV